jgi:hypothetical protein
MNDTTNGRFKRAAGQKKGAPVKRVKLSADAVRVYEEEVRQRDERERTYGRHLGADNKGR